jgi:hypothetical protein
MRWYALIVIVCWLGVGCASTRDSRSDATNGNAKQAPASAARSQTQPRPAKEPKTLSSSSLSVTNKNAVMTLANPMSGAVMAVNPNLRFVVLDYAMKPMPSVDQRLSIYRDGQKVGEVRVSGPILSGNVVADIIAGEVQVGDEARKE